MNDHVYKYNKKTAIKKYWRCIVSSCKVYVHATLDDLYLRRETEPHEHAPNPELIEVKKVREQKKHAIDEVMSVEMIYDEEMAKVSMSTSAVAIFPTNHKICTYSLTLFE